MTKGHPEGCFLYCPEGGIYTFKFALSHGIKTRLVCGDTTFKNNGKGKENDMEFLKEILGEELFAQIEAKVNEHNGNEANKEKQVKIGNLGTGEYVSKGKYDALQELVNGKETELKSANDLIAEMKKATKGNEELQGKFTEYEQENARLQAELQETKIKSAIKVALLSEKAVDVDYLTFKLNEKLKEKGEAIELDENDNIRGWDDKLSGLKTQFPSMFESEGTGRMKVLGEGKLPGSDDSAPGITQEQFSKMGYQSRLKLKQEQPEVYAQMTGKQ
jgi:hypothetical protein